MDTKSAIKAAIDTSNMISTSYLGDLTDEEMMHRPAPAANHIKWQVGHLIASEFNMINQVAPGSLPALPDGFADKYNKETSKLDDASAFDSKADLLALHEKQRAATLAALETIADEEFDKPSPEEIQAYAPTVGHAFLMQDVHWMMHAGQWAVVRRQLGREPMF